MNLSKQARAMRAENPKVAASFVAAKLGLQIRAVKLAWSREDMGVNLRGRVHGTSRKKQLKHDELPARKAVLQLIERGEDFTTADVMALGATWSRALRAMHSFESRGLCVSVHPKPLTMRPVK